MNTVFKFYMQVWILLSVVGGVAVVWAWPALNRSWRWRRLWLGIAAALLFLAALYPLQATKAKWQVRMSKEAPVTLDGMAFMPYVAYGDTDYLGNSVTIPLAGDYDALRWLQANVAGTPTIVEADARNFYRAPANRVAMFTGLPTVIGWDWHQRQQRAVLPGSVVTKRLEDVRHLYSTSEVDEALRILERYEVEYIFLGALERAYFSPEGLAKFESMAGNNILQPVYREGETVIYRVSADATGQLHTFGLVGVP